jgi:S-adenosylmethionine/arginine decarboxylase-like enzyme
MNHFICDGFKGFRSRFDDIELVYELLEDIPLKLGLQPVMPPFILPYYNGVEPEECGISGFVFLLGGHFTIHTFSFRESFFADLVSPSPFDCDILKELLRAGLPCSVLNARSVSRTPGWKSDSTIDRKEDFGPHLFLDIDGYAGPVNMDGLFDVFDTLPSNIKMTPIMRPYGLKTAAGNGNSIISIMTMIAESHICMHVFLERRIAFFDIFSCRFFDAERVLDKLRQLFPGTYRNAKLIARGMNYNAEINSRMISAGRSRAWVSAITRGED